MTQSFACDAMPHFSFFKMLGTDELRAWYGPDHVCLASDRGAIGTLLISDDLFRYDGNPLSITIKPHDSIDPATQIQGKDTCPSLKLSSKRAVK